MTGLYAILQLCQNDQGVPMVHLIHAVVLLMSANREWNLKRRDLLRPDLNKQYGALCNPTTPLSTFLFGDDLNKEVEELTKSNKLSGEVLPKHRFTPYRIPSTSGGQTSLRYGQQDTRVRSSRSLRPFLRSRPRPVSAPSPRKTSQEQRVNVGNVVSTEVSQLYETCLSVISNQLTFQAGSNFHTGFGGNSQQQY